MSAENSLADEYFFAMSLQGNKAIEVWDPDNEAKDEVPCGHKLVIRQIVLGPEAKEGEVHVVEAEAMMYKDSAKVPIAVLSKNGTSQIALDLSFPDPPVTFGLKQGTGPVHLIGHHLIGTAAEEYEGIDDFDEEEGIEEEDEEITASDDVNDDKQKKNGKAKRTEDEEDNEDEGPRKKPKVLGVATAANANAASGQSTNNVKKAQPQKNKKK